MTERERDLETAIDLALSLLRGCFGRQGRDMDPDAVRAYRVLKGAIESDGVPATAAPLGDPEE